MLLRRYRLVIQHVMFVVMMYGGRFGVKLGPALPCFACPYVAGCGGYCYLGGLQGYIGFGIAAADFWGFEGLRAIGYLLMFVGLVMLLGKAWCGFVCPFGLVSDWLTLLRRRLGIPEWKISPDTARRLGPIKYAFLAYCAAGPVLINLGILHPDFDLPFCQMFCPGKPLLPLFIGETRYSVLDLTNSATIVKTACSLAAAGGCLAAMSVRPRFFCTFCPMLALIHLLKPLTPLALRKNPALCRGCGSCQRVCGMDVERVGAEMVSGDVQTAACVNCGDCVAGCSSDGALSLKFAGKTVVSSSAGLALGIRKGGKRGRGGRRNAGMPAG
ncbi:MAG: 4Fe-4S binding protein [Deltaproteobacteria bacterium]|jgi:polyferredoxin|nr:4Fe-4S binding protein [Deltaproteobacteria bacterium]